MFSTRTRRTAWLELEEDALDEIPDDAELRLTVASPPQPTARTLVLQLWLSTADGVWARLEPELKVAAASLDGILQAMRAHLVAAGKLTTASPAVGIDSMWRTDGFDEDWAAVSTIDDIPDRARLRVLVPPDPSLDLTSPTEQLSEMRRLLSEHATTMGCCDAPFQRASACLRAACASAFPGVVLTAPQDKVKAVSLDAPANRGHLMTASAVNSWRKAFNAAAVAHPGHRSITNM